MRSNKFCWLVVILGLIRLTTLSSLSASEKATHEFIVNFKNSNVLMSDFIQRIGAHSLKKLRVDGNFSKVTFVSDQSQQQLLNILHNDESVEFAEPNMIFEAWHEPIDKEYNRQWYLNNVGGKIRFARNVVYTKKGADIKMAKLWKERPDILEAAKDVLVAVIDSGIYIQHPDLQSNIYTNDGEIGAWEPANDDQRRQAPIGCKDKRCNKIDDDNNGYIDDYHGTTWVEHDSSQYPDQGWDDNGHGSHVAGVIGARHNDKYIAGINDRVQLLPLKFLSKKGSGTLEGGMEAIQYAIDRGADIINASWGSTGYSRALHMMVQHASDNGVLFVAAAGNSGLLNDLFPHIPSDFPVDGLMSVGASDFQDNRAWFSNFSKNKVHVFAPGQDIMSTIIPSRYGMAYNFSGTSMAAPQVSGLAALLIGLYPDRFKNNPVALKKYIMQTGDRLTHLNNYVVSGTRINAYNAVMGQVPVGNTGPLTSGQWVSKDYVFQSAHPYENEAEVEYVIEVDQADWVRVHFGRHYLENHKDFVEIYDREGNLFDVVSGFGKSYISRAVKGNYIKLILRSDKQVTGWGFEVNKIEILK